MSSRAALERVAKWRTLLAGWQLGTRPKGEPESDAVRDHREATIMLRVEVTALVGLLLKKGIITIEEYDAALELEADELSKAFSRKFRGVTATDAGLSINIAEVQEHETFKGWRA